MGASFQAEFAAAAILLSLGVGQGALPEPLHSPTNPLPFHYQNCCSRLA